METSYQLQVAVLSAGLAAPACSAILPCQPFVSSEAYRACNFGLLDISWNKMGGPKLKVDIRGEQGQVALSQSIDVASLRMGSL